MALMTQKARPVPTSTPKISDLAAGIRCVKPRPHHAPLLEYLREVWPEMEFQHRLTRSGWYRPGGVLSSTGQELGKDLEAWLNQSLEKVQDFDQLLVDLEVIQPLVTRYNGATHFFTARYADRPEACWQLEVEELQEVMDRRLLNEQGDLPEDIADLLEPLQPALLDGQPMGAPVYQLGCLINLHEALADAVNEPLLRRFFQEWQRGPASNADFQQFWFFQRHESLSRYGVNQLRLQPHAINAKQLKTLPWDLDADATGVSTQLRAYDKVAGYSGAWYFGLVAGNLVPRELASRLQEDWLSDFRYISENQHALVVSWLHQPYTL
ncbi:hypothetical protein [Marinospirillum perlucidum]|uniref:hypothetical protein n=1 Tax=Marinospirillum perlucidum TaxID=1982602 RepID=UPI000DF4BACC|nr:hypothetical protein [Marinospirillum perlucidum]